MNSHIFNTAVGEWPKLSGDRNKRLVRRLMQNAENLEDLKRDLGGNASEKLKSFSGQQLICEKVVGRPGQTQKMLLKTHDGCPVETVRLPEGHKTTICVSSQSGCAYDCRFCATGKMGLYRSLETWEIVDQVLAWRRAGNGLPTNVVFMGMGEPLANLDAVLGACDLLADTRGLSMAYRKMTISTIGLTRGIHKLARQSRHINLILSLHATTDEQRQSLMPRSAKIKDIREALLDYQHHSKRRIGVAYLVKASFNDHDEDVERLTEFLEGMTFKLNLLCHNPVGAADQAVSVEEVEAFKRKITGLRRGVVTVRYPAGRENWAACGQLGATLSES